MKKIASGEIDSIEVTQGVYSGILINLVVEATANNDALDLATDIDLEQPIIKVLKQTKGKQVVIMQNQLIQLYRHFHIDSYDYDKMDMTISGSGQELVVEGASVKNKIVITYFLPFGGEQHLRQQWGEKLEFEMNLQSTTFIGGAAGSASYAQIDFVKGMGTELWEPKTVVHSIKANAPQDAFDFVNAVKITLINLDKTSQLEADAVISQFSLSTPEIGESSAYTEVLNNQSRYLNNLTLSDRAKRNQNMVLFQVDSSIGYDDPITGTVDLSFNGSNVNAGKCFLVITTVEIDPVRYSVGEATVMKRSIKKRQANGIPLESDAEALQANRGLQAAFLNS